MTEVARRGYPGMKVSRERSRSGREEEKEGDDDGGDQRAFFSVPLFFSLDLFLASAGLASLSLSLSLSVQLLEAQEEIEKQAFKWKPKRLEAKHKAKKEQRKETEAAVSFFFSSSFFRPRSFLFSRPPPASFLSFSHLSTQTKPPPPPIQSVKDLPIVQDGPPPGGFPAVRYARRIPSTGPAGATLFAVGAAVMAFGFYRVGQGNKHRREIRREKVARREALYPVLQAEEDRSWCARKEAAVEKEAELMKGVPGWEAGKSVYSPGARWVPPAAPYGSWGASG